MEQGALDEVLKHFRTAKTLMIALIAVIPVILAATLLADGSVSLLLMSAAGVVAVGAPVFLLFYMKKKNEKLLEDEAKGEKIIIKGQLSGKQMQGARGYYTYYFFVGNRSLKVETEIYHGYEANAYLEIHIAPLSEYVLDVKALKV